MFLAEYLRVRVLTIAIDINMLSHSLNRVDNYLEPGGGGDTALKCQRIKHHLISSLPLNRSHLHKKFVRDLIRNPKRYSIRLLITVDSISFLFTRKTVKAAPPLSTATHKRHFPN